MGKVYDHISRNKVKYGFGAAVAGSILGSNLETYFHNKSKKKHNSDNSSLEDLKNNDSYGITGKNYSTYGMTKDEAVKHSNATSSEDDFKDRKKFMRTDQENNNAVTNYLKDSYKLYNKDPKKYDVENYRPEDKELT